MLKKILVNTKKPQGFWGKVMLGSMNIGHGPMAKWGLRHIQIEPDAYILDIGCGGGKNIKRMLKKTPRGRVFGVDYSALSVRKSRRLNADQVLKERAVIMQGSVSQMPFKTAMFNIVTAFETVYFWPDIVNDMREVYRVLKPGGSIFICNEAARDEKKPARYNYFINTIGIKVYSEEELATALKQAGYINISTIRHQSKNRICTIAEKPEKGELE